MQQQKGLERFLLIVAMTVACGLIGAYLFTKPAKAEEKKAGEDVIMETGKLWSQSYNQAVKYFRMGKLELALTATDTAMEEGGGQDPEVRILRVRIFWKQLDIARAAEEAVVAVQLAKGTDKNSKEIKKEAEGILAQVQKFYAPVRIIPAAGFPDVFDCPKTIIPDKKVVIKVVQDRIRSGKDKGPWTAYLPLGEKCLAGNITIELKSAEIGQAPSVPVPMFTATMTETRPNVWNVSLYGTFTDGAPLGLSGRWAFYSRPYWAISLEAGTMYTLVDMSYSTKRLGETYGMVKSRLGPESFYGGLGVGGAVAYADRVGVGWTAMGAVGSTVRGWIVEMQIRATGAGSYMYWLAPLCVGRNF